MNINRTFKEKLMKHQSRILVGNPDDIMFDGIPDDAYVIDTRKDISKYPNYFSASSLDYAIEYGRSLGYSDDKIYLIYECYKVHGQVYKRKGSQCDKDEDEIIQEYNDMGFVLQDKFEDDASGDDT